MKQIVIAPYARALRNGKVTPKNYPWWEDLIGRILVSGPEWKLIQIGNSEEKEIVGVNEFKAGLKLTEIRDLLQESDTWISVDSFLQHLNNFYLKKPGVVLWGQSDPRIFGYPYNYNLYTDRKYFRKQQYWLWEQTDLNNKAFVLPGTVFDTLRKILASK